MQFTEKKRGRPAQGSKPRSVRGWRLVLSLLWSLGGIVGCSTDPSWRNRRIIYLRNRTAADLRLTWRIPRAHLQPAGPWPPGAGLIEPGGLPPRLRYSATDTLLDNYEQVVAVHARPAAGDSVALTMRIPPGGRYLISSYEESFRAPDRNAAGGCTFLPGILSWRTPGGHLLHRSIHPFRWRQAQDREADRQRTQSYTLVRYIDYE